MQNQQDPPVQWAPQTRRQMRQTEIMMRCMVPSERSWRLRRSVTISDNDPTESSTAVFEM